MNTKLLLLAITAIAFGSCTTLYKSGQTPDDVYYSPVRPYGDDGKKEDRNDEERREEVRNTSTYRSNNNYDYEDRTIRLGINDRRWRYFDNDYTYNPYNYGFNYGYYYNPYYWPSPVYSPVFYTPSNPKNTTPRKISLGGYTNNTGYINNNLPTVNGKMGIVRPSTRSYNNNNNGSAVGNVIRQIFTPSTNTSNRSTNNTYNNNNSSNNTRTYTPAPSSSSSSSSSSGSSSGSGSISRPPRSGGN